MMFFKKFIRIILPVKIRKIIFQDMLRNANLCYSQEGEDMILSRIFENKKNGFYVDIGAHHPQRFSNTMYFYKKGWRGINIDATPGSMIVFKKERPEDINLEVAISDEEKTLTFYVFNEPALNTFSESFADEIQKNEAFYVVSKKEMRTEKLESVLNKYLSNNQRIDFLSIDVEGLDVNVIKSNNWQKYAPDFVLVEIFGVALEDIPKTSVFLEMNKNGYTLIAKTINTAFFKIKN
jgi:FkbM family methyltransferase